MIELRVEGRRLLGTVIRYGEVGDPGFPEAFERGAFRGRANDVLLNVHHDRKQLIARAPGTLTLHDGPTELRMEAALPSTRLADDVITLVRARVLVGLSVGFQALRERMDAADVRIIERARLDHIAVCDRPAYHGSRVYARGAPDGLRIWQGWGDVARAMSTPVGNRVDVVRKRRWL